MCSYDGGSCGQQRGHDLAQLKLSNSSLDAFFSLFSIFDLLIRSHQQRRKKCPRVAAYIAP